ncbi:MAG: hypothetical protein U0163_21790 [Gemmatimonadaceae bacterium]
MDPTGFFDVPRIEGDAALDPVHQRDRRHLPRWVQAYRAEGALTPKPKDGGWQSPNLLPVLHSLGAEAPDATCAELCWAYNRSAPAAHQTTFTSLWRALRRSGYVLRKTAATE